MTIIIGIPKEVKEYEYRVSLTPTDVYNLKSSCNVIVYVEKNAGINASFTDDDYIKAGAFISSDKEVLFLLSNIIVKVKEPQECEYRYITENHLIFTFFHFASNLGLLKEMIRKKTTCIAYETIKKDDGTYPILCEMSKIAGEKGLEKALTENKENKEIKISIIGVGNAGKAATYKALELGYKNIHLIDIDKNKMNVFEEFEECFLYEMNERNLKELVKTSNVIIGSIYNTGKKAERLITNEMLDHMIAGSIIIDIAIDQGGITEQSLPTKLANPFISYKNTRIYCVPNIPSLVPYEASEKLSGVILPYLKMMILEPSENWSEELKRGINIYNGELLISL